LAWQRAPDLITSHAANCINNHGATDAIKSHCALVNSDIEWRLIIAAIIVTSIILMIIVIGAGFIILLYIRLSID